MNESVFSKFVLHRKGIHYKDIIKEDLARIPGTRQLLEWYFENPTGALRRGSDFEKSIGSNMIRKNQ